MPIRNLLESASGLRIFEYRCAAGPADIPFTEVFADFSLSYVARGSFGCRTRGRHFELVAGSFLVGRSGDEYRCSHEHHDGGDECRSFRWSNSALEGTLWSWFCRLKGNCLRDPLLPRALKNGHGCAGTGQSGIENVSRRASDSADPVANELSSMGSRDTGRSQLPLWVR